MENDINDDPYESEIEIVRPKSLWFRFLKCFQSREKLKYRPRKKSIDEVHFKRLFQAKSNFGQTKEEKIFMKWWKNCYSQEYFQSFDQPQCQRTKSLTDSRTDETKIHSGNISSENFDSGFQSRESGFLSHDASSKASTPNSPNNEVLELQTIVSKDEESPIEQLNACEKRKNFYRQMEFHNVIEDDLTNFEEWIIPQTELSFGKKIVHQSNHSIFNGKWHGDVIIHMFNTSKPESKIDYLNNVSALMNIRHENIVSFMGWTPMYYDKMDIIITNPVRAISLYAARQSELTNNMSEAKKMSIVCQIAHALGYLHAKDIVHGRLCSRNVFLESKVQLSVLDYAVGQSNVVYSSPQLLNQINTASEPHYNENTSIQITKEDDIFAFGTLIFEIFAGFLPFDNEKPKSSLSLLTDISQKIKCDQIHDQLRNFPSNKAEKLKRVISACWHSQKHHRISLSELTANFTPGNCLVRRHSISEPQLDKILCSTYLNK